MKTEELKKQYGLTEAQYTGKEKVGGYLDLSGLTSIPKGFNPTVGGSLYLSGKEKYIGAQVAAIQINNNFFWQKESKRYALIDTVFCEILTERKHMANGISHTIYSAKKVNKDEHFFIVGDGTHYAHGEDLKKAVEDLQFKIVAEKLKSEPITPTTEITVNHYRLVTGACELGVKEWMAQNGLTGEEKMKAADLLPILRKTNAYGLQRFESLLNF